MIQRTSLVVRASTIAGGACGRLRSPSRNPDIRTQFYILVESDIVEKIQK